MMKFYFRSTIRNFKTQAVYSVINVVGLMLGLCIASVILLFVINELTFDTYHKDAKQIYRLGITLDFGSSQVYLDAVNSPLGPLLVNYYPKTLCQTRISEKKEINFMLEDKIFNEELYCVDSSFFSIFTNKFIYGDPKSALGEPFSLVITEKISQKYYGKSNPVGQVLRTDNGQLYKVTAVIRDVPDNTNFKFDMLSSFENIYILKGDEATIDGWGIKYPRFETYIKISEDYTEEELSIELSKIVETYLSDHPVFKYTIKPQALTDLHLKIGFRAEHNMERLILFVVIGIFILLIASINFINLRTLQASNRLLEVGIKKVFGAQRKQLIWQFLFETFLLCIVSMTLALTLAEIILPDFNNFVERKLVFTYWGDFSIGIWLVLLTAMVGLIAGSYPAFYMSSFKPIIALQGRFITGTGKAIFRNSLVVLQFVISIALIICAVTVRLQMNYITNFDIGFDSENIIRVPLHYEDKLQNAGQLKEELSRIPEISSITQIRGVPFVESVSSEVLDENMEGKTMPVDYLCTDEDFIDFMGLKIVQGRNFSANLEAESGNVLINETFVKRKGWQSPIGKSIEFSRKGEKFKVIGVVKDFHVMPFKIKIRPMVLELSDKYISLMLRTSADQKKQVLEKIKKTCKDFDPFWNVDLSFLDTHIEKHYEEDKKMGRMLFIITIIAIFIALIGLFGLASFKAKQRIKEIGIRKTFGASVNEIIKILSLDFLKLVLISSVIAIPLSWYYLDRWLQNFAYHVELSWWIFAISTLIALLISFITIAKLSLRAATSNPVDVIKYE